MLRIIFCCLFFKEVVCLVCNGTKSVTREVPETFRYTYFEAYEDDDCYLRVLCSTKSRQAASIGIKRVKKVVNETVMSCCGGYTEDLSYNGDGIKCVPICNPPCLNGYCREPDQCACEWGFGLDPDTPNRCQPLCLEGCSMPDCLSTCSRHQEPETCPEPCGNGTCVTGLCQCEPGYHLSDQNICEPTCTSCDHGVCKAPEICDCMPGWSGQCGSCHPICTNCDHGKCVSPEQCECETGYENRSGKCEPVCSSCNGVCISPDVCVCDPGWYKSGTECLAHCDSCVNGYCVAPNVCQCYLGYTEDIGSQCVPVCTNCDGICTAPDVCECRAPYVSVYMTADGAECTDASIDCYRKSCKINSEAVNASEITAANDYVADGTSEDLLNKSYSNDSTSGISPVRKSFFISEPLYHWIYCIIIVVELLVIILLLAIFKRKHLLNRLKTKKYVPKDTSNEEATVRYSTKMVVK